MCTLRDSKSHVCICLILRRIASQLKHENYFRYADIFIHLLYVVLLNVRENRNTESNRNTVSNKVVDKEKSAEFSSNSGPVFTAPGNLKFIFLWCGRKTFDAFNQLLFQIPPAWCEPGLYRYHSPNAKA